MDTPHFIGEIMEESTALHRRLQAEDGVSIETRALASSLHADLQNLNLGRLIKRERKRGETIQRLEQELRQMRRSGRQGRSRGQRQAVEAQERRSRSGGRGAVEAAHGRQEHGARIRVGNVVVEVTDLSRPSREVR